MPTSIQAKEPVQHRHGRASDWDVVIDDHGTGEIADIVAMRRNGQDLALCVADALQGAHRRRAGSAD